MWHLCRMWLLLQWKRDSNVEAWQYIQGRSEIDGPRFEVVQTVIHFDMTLYFLSTFLPCHHQNCLLDLDRCECFVLLEIVASEHPPSSWILSRQQPMLQQERKTANQMYIRDLKIFAKNQSYSTATDGQSERKRTCFDIIHSFLLLNSSATDVVVLGISKLR